MNIKRFYYDDIDISFEIIHQLYAKETAFIPLGKGAPIRWKKAHAIHYLKKHFKRYKFLDNKMNIYHSLASYNNMPLMSYNVLQQKEQQKAWGEVFHKHIIAYDFFLETDCDNLKEAFIDAIEIKAILDKFNLRYSKQFSGSKGVHFLIKYEEFKHLPVKIYDPEYNKGKWIDFMRKFPMPHNNIECDLVRLFKAVCYRIKTMHSLDTVDITITDIKRLKKVAYSIDDKSGLVAYALSDKQLYNFNKSDYEPLKVLKMNNTKRRLLCNNLNKKPMVNEFLEYLGIVTSSPC